MNKLLCKRNMGRKLESCVYVSATVVQMYASEFKKKTSQPLKISVV